MTRRIIIAPAASDDLDEIWRYIARDSIDVAERVINEIEREIRRLAENPGFGHQRGDVRDKRLRFWRIYSYLIAYTYDDAVIRIARIISGYRDLKKLFKRE